jgi:heat shock protein HtpX
MRLATDNRTSPALTSHELQRACSAWLDTQLPSNARRQIHHEINAAQSGRFIAGLTTLLALCGWIDGGDEGARRAVVNAVPPPQGSTRETMRRRHDARLLHPFEAPELFAVVHAISRRARLVRMPEIYVLPAESSMNAYALGSSNDAVVTLTAGLLRGMTIDEVAAIVAHEIAHISSNDASTMAFSASLQRAVGIASLAGLATLARRRTPLAAPLMWLLESAPVIAELLCLGLSRIRELAADALALDLIADCQPLASALEKLERHHRQTHPLPLYAADDDVSSYLRSHPTTDQRVRLLRGLA